MNVYRCWYRGNLGFCCRRRGTHWLFVPELGQPNPAIYKHARLDDLIFDNPLAQRMEQERERERSQGSRLKSALTWLFPIARPQTVGGYLFLP